MVYSSLPVFMALLDAANTTLLAVVVTYPGGIPEDVAVVSVDDPGERLEIVNENGSYTKVWSTLLPNGRSVVAITLLRD
jgi:hypothetical protein